MAAGAVGITMADAACRRTNPGITGQSGVATTRRIADRGFDLTSAGGETRGDTPRQIQPLRRGTTARRITQFRTGYVSRTEDVKPGLLRGRSVSGPTLSRDGAGI